mgnify:CR=1 FL=1
MQTKLSFKKKGIQHDPINHWELTDGNIIAIYQGARGDNPELDFVVKYLAPNKRLRAPSHTHWIVDLLVKAEVNKLVLSEYVDKLIEMYDELTPFKSEEERVEYNLKYPTKMTTKFKVLQGHGYYSIETLTAFIELFSINEKQTTGAFMFRSLLTLVKEYCEGKKDFYQVVGYSKRV